MLDDDTPAEGLVAQIVRAAVTLSQSSCETTTFGDNCGQGCRGDHMRVLPFACVAAFAVLMPAAAQADDPNDPALRNAAARARDREIIRQLNLKELARVRERDAGYAKGWREWRGQASNAGARGYERDVEHYTHERADYERRMAAWRRAVSACRSGDYDACEGQGR